MPDSPPNSCCPGLKRFIGFMVIVVGTIMSVAIAWWLWPGPLDPEATAGNSVLIPFADTHQVSATPDTVVPEEPKPDPHANQEPAASADELMSERIVGKWATERAVGHRDLVVKEDGTAQMTVNIDSAVKKLIFGARLIIEIKWHIADGFLNFEMVGGEPKASVEMLSRMGGDSLAFEILELSEDRLLVKDTEDDPDHDWQRVEDGDE